jgi:hypothetical protein
VHGRDSADYLPQEARREFDSWFAIVLRRAIAQTLA